jgi:hypothetical protein
VPSSLKESATQAHHHSSVVQAMAVLLLDMAYANNNKEIPNPNIIESIKKLIRWLRAIQYNDPVAARAYQVVWRILKTVAPELQAKANDLLAVDDEDIIQHHDYNYQPPALAPDNYVPWPHEEPGAQPTNPDGTYSSQPYYPQPLNDPLSVPAQFHPMQDGSMPMPLGNIFFTSFDQGTPFAGMQDMWSDPATFTAFDANWPNLDPPPEEFAQGAPAPYPEENTPRKYRDWNQM